MLRFDAFDESNEPTLHQFPKYVDPKEDEALISWLLRLATRLEVSLQTLIHHGFWIEGGGEPSEWWRRPEPLMLWRIHNKTGVSVERLRRMTLEGWSPAYRDDESNERFSPQRFRAIRPRLRTFRYVLCEQCFEGDSDPHLRLPWTLGWVAVCPLHKTILTIRCQKCMSKFQIGIRKKAPFAPVICEHCGNDIRYGLHEPALPPALQLQQELLDCKRNGVADFTGIGRLTWIEVVVLIDVLLGMFWTNPMGKPWPNQRQRYAEFRKECELSDAHRGSSRYRDLTFFAWLTQTWPHGNGSQLALDLLARWLRYRPNHIFRHLGLDLSEPWKPDSYEVPESVVEQLWLLLEAPRGFQRSI